MKKLEKEIKDVKKQIKKLSKLSPEAKERFKEFQSPLNELERRVCGQHILEKIDQISDKLEDALVFQPKKRG